MKKVMLSEMPWPEVEEVIKKKPTVLLPMGTVETQNRHNPTGYDYFVAERLAVEAARKSANAVVAPTICYGYSDLFIGFPGTITLKPETLQNLVYDVVECLVQMGLTNIVFVNNHDPNTPILKMALARIREKYGYVYPILWPTKMAHAFGQQVFPDAAKVLVHGNEPSTSLSAYLCPDMVRPDLAVDVVPEKKTLGPLTYASGGAFAHEGLTVPFNARMKDTNENGGSGCPRPDPEKGQIIFEKMVDFTVSFVDKFNQVDNQFDK